MEKCKYQGVCGLEDCAYNPETCTEYKNLEKVDNFWKGWPLEKDITEVLK